MRVVNMHIIHCSDTFMGNVKSFRRYHVNTKKWDDIGYHYVIRRDGEIEVGRPLEIAGAHCRGKNQHSVGTCLVGKKVFTPAQYSSLIKLNKTLKELFPEMTTHPHNEFNKDKTCPNFDIYDYLPKGPTWKKE